MNIWTLVRYLSFSAALLVTGCCWQDCSETTAIVARVTIAQKKTALAPGATIKLQAVAYNADDAVIIDSVVRWSISDSSVATVDNSGTVIALSLGKAQITAEVGSIQSEPINIWVNPPATGDELINQSLSSGKISQEQALVYEILLVMNDDRLPGEFYGTLHGGAPTSTRIFAPAVENFGSLSSWAPRVRHQSDLSD